MRNVNHLLAIPGRHQRKEIEVWIRTSLNRVLLRFVDDAYILVVENEHALKLILSDIEIHLDVVYIFVTDKQLLKSQALLQ